MQIIWSGKCLVVVWLIVNKMFTRRSFYVVLYFLSLFGAGDHRNKGQIHWEFSTNRASKIISACIDFYVSWWPSKSFLRNQVTAESVSHIGPHCARFTSIHIIWTIWTISAIHSLVQSFYHLSSHDYIKVSFHSCQEYPRLIWRQYIPVMIIVNYRSRKGNWYWL